MEMKDSEFLLVLGAVGVRGGGGDRGNKASFPLFRKEDNSLSGSGSLRSAEKRQGQTVSGN